MEFIPFLVGDDNNSFLCYHVFTRHSFYKATPPAISPEEFGTSHNIAIIKKNLRSRMSFTPGNGTSNEMPFKLWDLNWGVATHALGSLVFVCGRGVCFCWWRSFPLLLLLLRRSGFFRLLRTTNCVVTGFLVSLLHCWLVIFHPAMRRFISSLPNHTIDWHRFFSSFQIRRLLRVSSLSNFRKETEIRYSYHVMVILQQFQARLAVVLEIFCCGSAW